MNTGRGAHSATSSCAVDRQVVGRQRAGVLDEVARHPVVLARAGDVLHLLAEVPPMELGAAGARRADEPDREPLVVGHRDDGGLAVARQALDADLLGVDRLVGLKVVERAAGAPRPRPERAPVVQLSRLPLVEQADDAARQPGAVVGLDAGRDEDGVAPALRQQLLLPGRAWRRTAAAAPPAGRGPKPNSIITGTGPVAFAGVVSVSWMSTVTCGYEELSTWPTSFLVTTGTSPTTSSARPVTSHRTLGVRGGRAAVDLAIEVLDDLGAALRPLRRSRDLLAVLHHQRVRQRGVRVGLRLVDVGRVWRLRVAARPRAQAT